MVSRRRSSTRDTLSGQRRSRCPEVCVCVGVWVCTCSSWSLNNCQSSFMLLCSARALFHLSTLIVTQSRSRHVHFSAKLLPALRH